jgi:hypothetical protein
VTTGATRVTNHKSCHCDPSAPHLVNVSFRNRPPARRTTFDAHRLRSAQKHWTCRFDSLESRLASQVHRDRPYTVKTRTHPGKKRNPRLGASRTCANFAPFANEMRAAIDGHFSNPYERGAMHQIWEYWNVPDLYCYLRTHPQNVLGTELYQTFMGYLSTWSLEKFGLLPNSRPWLSIYVQGCEQQPHNDAGNGRFGYTYSLTRWRSRRFSGGETVLFDKTSQLGAVMSCPAAGHDIYSSVPARFNQLLIFDDTLVHGVRTVSGHTSPQDGRIVIHGHLREAALRVDGSLETESVRGPVGLLYEGAQGLLDSFEGVAGLLVVRCTVSSTGSILRVNCLTNSLRSTEHGRARRLARGLLALASEGAFPKSESGGRITIPFAISLQ